MSTCLFVQTAEPWRLFVGKGVARILARWRTFVQVSMFGTQLSDLRMNREGACVAVLFAVAERVRNSANTPL